MADVNDINCNTNFSTNKTGNLTQYCATAYIDVNGSKGPNNLGRDVFAFYLTNGKGPMLYPEGGQDDANNGLWSDNSYGYACGVGGSIFGWLCAGRVIEEGWQMNY